VDKAFELFNADGEGCISAAELRRIFCESGGTPLMEDEFGAMLDDLGISSGGHVSVKKLREHASFTA
jgi:Ca2+-binding EF-hand superfamily protein